MKGALAAMMCALKDIDAQDRVRVQLVCVPDEESEEIDDRSTDAIVARGYTGDFAITGEPTDMHIGIEAKGVLVMRIVVHGRAAHSSTPWLGENAVLKAIDVFRSIQSLPFARESSEMFDRPSINLGRIEGGRALNMVPDLCTMAVDVRYLPGQDPADILTQVRTIEGIDVTRTFIHPTVSVSRTDPYVRALRDAVARSIRGEVMSVGRDGASDAAAFIQSGVPAVEFGPAGPATTAPRSGCRCARWRATGGRWPISSARSRSGSRRAGTERRAARDRGRAGVSWLDPARPPRRGRALSPAAAIVILFTAATTAVAGLLDIKQGAAELNQQEGLDIKGVTIPGYGARRRCC